MKIRLSRSVATAETRVISGVIVSEYNRPGRHRGKFLLGVAAITDAQNKKYERAFSSSLDDSEKIAGNLVRDNLRRFKRKYGATIKKVDLVYYDESVSNDRLRELKHAVTVGNRNIYSVFGKHGN